MENNEIHKQLKRQIAKFLPQELLENNSDLQQFIKAVNLTYLSFERDAELSELSSRLNDKEYFQTLEQLIIKKERTTTFKNQYDRIDECKQL